MKKMYFGSLNSRPTRGFSLIELLVTLLIGAILVTLAGPSFIQYIATQRVRNASYDLTSALMVARSEAIKRNACVNLVRTSSSWTSGWKVKFPCVNPTTVIRSQDAYQGLAISDTSSLSEIAYGNDGRATTATTVFRIDPPASASSVTRRCVTIGLSGTPTSTLGGC